MALTVNFTTIQKRFFDRQKVADAAERATDRVLWKAGAYIRTRARRSIRRRKRPSQPGNPPSHHADRGGGFGDGLKFILFGKDGPGRVIVGPVGHSSGRSSVPQLMERGGTVTYHEKQISTDLAEQLGLREPWVVYGPENPPNKHWQKTRTRTVTIAARPFMAPAFAHVIKVELPDELRGMLDGGFPASWSNSGD